MNDKVMKKLNVKFPVEYDKLHWFQRRIIREQYIIEQGKKCYHCNYPLDGEPSEEILKSPITKRLFPPNFFKHPIHLHHDHNTGLTIGAVHARCNAVLWEYYRE